ncbi:MAG TPA: mechanosensitive ion channel family protein [Terracidiphilus sp.]|nr:mechanosensitive ion channel family protein [Terracidiphilus sp.]
MNRTFLRIFTLLLMSGVACAPLFADQTAGQTAQSSTPAQAPVTVDGKTIFTVQGVLSFPPAARADAIASRIKDLSKDVSASSKPVTVSDAEGTSDIVAGDLVVMSVTDQDARAAGTTRQKLAQEYADRITAALKADRSTYSVKSLLLGGAYALLATAALFFLFRLVGIVFRQLYRKLDSWRGTVIRSLRIQRFELLPADRITDFAIEIARLLRFAVVLVALYFYASLVLGFFPWTRGYAHVLLVYVLSPLRLVGSAIAAYMPNVFFIAVIVFIAFYVVKFTRIIFTEIAKGTITVPDFYPEWAQPTYKIVRVLILALTAVVIFPYLPWAQSPAFRGISIFLGVLLSLGSTSAVANIVAGVILTYMRAFKIGDRVQIADTTGDVIEKTLLVTRVRTIKNVDVTIANAMVLSSHIINFSASALKEGLILHTSVTIGYDAPWRTVHQLLVDAALSCENILHDPKPFVLQTALDDFYVHYEINAFTDQPNLMAGTYSELHEKIQDKFNEAGVEIMSSHYANVRDGNKTTVPDQYLPSGYTPPSFHLGLDALTQRFKGPLKPEE